MSKPELSFEELRAIKAKRRAEKSWIQSQIEQDADKIYTIQIDEENEMRYKRWTHEQASMFYSLPFAHKFISKTELDANEKALLQIVRHQMIASALVDKDRWAMFLSEADDKTLDSIYARMFHTSMISGDFAKKLMDFFDTERGFMYGLFWYVIQGKVSSDIAKLADSDVLACNLWLAKWGEKLKEKS